eukprot:COSAG06_NODE_459_length_15440_cov_87.208135_12_plen_173_part_00
MWDSQRSNEYNTLSWIVHSTVCSTAVYGSRAMSTGLYPPPPPQLSIQMRCCCPLVEQPRFHSTEALELSAQDVTLRPRGASPLLPRVWPQQPRRWPALETANAAVAADDNCPRVDAQTALNAELVREGCQRRQRRVTLHNTQHTHARARAHSISVCISNEAEPCKLTDRLHN